MTGSGPSPAAAPPGQHRKAGPLTASATAGSEPDRREDGAAELQRLAEVIDSDEFDTKIQTMPGRRARLRVRNRSAGMLTESIYAAPDADDVWWFWWGWSDPIAPATDMHVAARKIRKVLRALDAVE